MRLGSLGWHQLRRALNAGSRSWEGKGTACHCVSLIICELDENRALGHLPGSSGRRNWERQPPEGTIRGYGRSHEPWNLLGGISENREAGTDVRATKEAEPTGLRN